MALVALGLAPPLHSPIIALTPSEWLLFHVQMYYFMCKGTISCAKVNSSIFHRSYPPLLMIIRSHSPLVEKKYEIIVPRFDAG
jgi:hypothetical protein